MNNPAYSERYELLIRRTLRVRVACILPALVLVCISTVNGCSAAAQFDGGRAFGFLKKQCSFGPRPLGTPAHDRTRDYLVEELKRSSDQVSLQNFTSKQGGKTYQLTNIIARFGKPDTGGIVLCAHWDTRPTADREADPARRKQPILGANDGASGVAVLLELARMFHSRPPAVPVTIALFDGEDFGPTSEGMYLGSKYFAKHLNEQPSYRYGILLDMVGDKDLSIPREIISQARAGFVVDKVWTAARALGYGALFPDRTKYAIQDDHIPLLDAGLPCADIIDFDYPYWHTLDDTVDKCSQESLQVVGDTIARVVYSEAP